MAEHRGVATRGAPGWPACGDSTGAREDRRHVAGVPAKHVGWGDSVDTGMDAVQTFDRECVANRGPGYARRQQLLPRHDRMLMGCEQLNLGIKTRPSFRRHRLSFPDA